MLLLSQESAGKAESDALPGSIQTHHGIRCRMLDMRKKEEHLVNKTRMLRWIHAISLKDNNYMSEAIRKRAKKANCS